MTPGRTAKRASPEEAWREMLYGTHPGLKLERRVWRLLPSPPRCKLCNSPFGAPGSLFTRLIGKQRSRKNPNYCDMCTLQLRNFSGGAEVELTLLFADVRGSTTIAEQMSPSEFSRLLNRFYEVANRTLIDSDALVDKLVGDEVIGLYLPYLPDHPSRAVRAALDLLRRTGHGGAERPWIPVGAGIHTGVAYVGTVGTADTVQDVTALGDAVNITARLASVAGAGELLISAGTADALRRRGASGLISQDAEQRDLQLKGRAEPIRVHVLRPAATVVPA